VQDFAGVERTLTTAQLLAGLPTSVSKDSIRRWAREGLLPHDTTPGGHRRYSLDEVVAAISTERRSFLRPMVVGPGKTHLGTGPTAAESAADRLARRVAAVETTPTGAASTPAPSSRPARPATAVLQLLGHARRVLIASAP